jgi:hypothetical protein
MDLHKLVERIMKAFLIPDQRVSIELNSGELEDIKTGSMRSYYRSSFVRWVLWAP